MPWINEELCVHCGVCVAMCPVSAIVEEDGSIVIDQDRCIRCGRCHEVCSQGAVRHDSERVPQEVAANLERTRTLLTHYDDQTEQRQFMERMIRYFEKEKKVAGLTVEALTAMKSDIRDGA